MDSIVLKDITWDKDAPAGMAELFIPSEGSLLAGLIYKANGAKKHPTLLLLHGYPGNERNLDLCFERPQLLHTGKWLKSAGKQTDHPFTNKRVALIRMFLSFLDK